MRQKQFLYENNPRLPERQTNRLLHYSHRLRLR